MQNIEYRGHVTLGIQHVHELPFDPFENEREYTCSKHCPGYCNNPTVEDSDLTSANCPQCGRQFD